MDLSSVTSNSTLIVASGNVHKVREIEATLSQLQRFNAVVGVNQFDGSPPIIEETGATFMENAAIKAMGWACWLEEQGNSGHDWVLADDSGICIDALDGRPGIYSARFAGDGASDDLNNQRVVSELKQRGQEWSQAHYMCALAVARVDRRIMHRGVGANRAADKGSQTGVLPVESQACAGNWDDPRMLRVWGRCDGEISVHFRGQGGFGYDPHFWIDQRSGTFAELDPSQKAKRSHRGAALRNLAQCLSSTNFV